MMDKELYQKKMQAQLDEWKADIDNLRARASKTGADTQLMMNEQIKALDDKIEQGQVKLSELSGAGEDAWESIREGVDATWDSLKSAVNDAASKFNR